MRLETFIYKESSLYRWYVLNGTHVMDQGVAKTLKGAESKSNTSLMFISEQLELV